MLDGSWVGGDGMNAEAEGDQVQAPVAAGGAVPVDDAGDVAVAGEDVCGLVVVVDGVIAAEAAGVAGPGGGDPAVERPGAGAVLAQRLVQAEAGPVAGEVEIGGGDGWVAGELAGLEVAEGECLIEQCRGEVAEGAPGSSSQTRATASPAWMASSAAGAGYPAGRRALITAKGPSRRPARRVAGRQVSTERWLSGQVT